MMLPLYAAKNVWQRGTIRCVFLHFNGLRRPVGHGPALRAVHLFTGRCRDGALQIRTYTNMAHKVDRPGGDPETWFGIFYKGCIVGLAIACGINWRWVRDSIPWLPTGDISGSLEKRAEDQYMEDMAYDWGKENLPKSVASYYNLPDNKLIRKVDAAERPLDTHMIKGEKTETGGGDAAAIGGTEFKKGGFRDRKITEYENRIRAYSTPDKVFRLFATLKIHDEDGEGYGIYMTPDDFVRAITPGMRQPEGLGLDHFKTFDPAKDKLDASSVPADSIFHKLGENGLINFSDYLFLMTVLAISARHIEIAFKIFDVNGDGNVDAEEFEEILNVLRQQTSIGMRHREAKVTGNSYGQGKAAVNSGLQTFFFGKHGKGKLKVHDFLAFQARMKDEVLQMEFLRQDPENGKITEKNFAKMLLSYAGISEQKQKKMVQRVADRFQDDAAKGVSFQQVQSFSQVFRHLNDIDTALGLYHVAGGSIDQSTLQRVVKTVARADLDDHILDIVFTLFDDNDDGRLSQREFISIMKARQMRGLARPKDMGVTRLFSAVWKCAKEEIQGSRGG